MRESFAVTFGTGPILAVDAPALLYRAFFAVPDTVRDASGRSVNALLGTANTLLSVVELHKPRAVVLCLGNESAAYRVELYPPYHAHRPPMPPALEQQFDDAPAFFGAFGWKIATHEALEADDLVHSYAHVEADAGGRGLILTGDRDLFQSATDHVTVLMLQKGGAPPAAIGPAEVLERYGVTPEQVPDFIALRGDPSDGLPGAKGIGEKTARDLLRAHGTLERVIETCLGASQIAVRAIHKQTDLLRTFRRVATVQRVDVARPADTPLDRAGAAEAARARGMNRLADRLAGATARR